MEVFYTSSIEEISTIVDQYDSATSVFVACGGDGTVHAVAKTLVHRQSILGVLPLGSGNDFAKMLGATSSIQSYLNILKIGNIEAFDTIAFKNDVCINTFGLGVDGLTNQLAVESKVLKGKIKYVIAAIRAIFAIKKNKVRIHIQENEHSFATYLTLISNGRWEGGSYQLSPNSVPNDGIFELQVANINSRHQLFYQFIRLSIIGSFSKNKLTSFSCTSATLIYENTEFAHCDGEKLNPVKEISFQMDPASLKVLVHPNN